jgi:hypothetical protein
LIGHLTTTAAWDEYPRGLVVDREKVSALVDPDGNLWDNTILVAANVRPQ